MIVSAILHTMQWVESGCDFSVAPKGMFGRHPQRGFLATFRYPVENPRLDQHGKGNGGPEDSSFANIFRIPSPPLQIGSEESTHQWNCGATLFLDVNIGVTGFLHFLVYMGCTIKI